MPSRVQMALGEAKVKAKGNSSSVSIHWQEHG